jgi:hypothetical protein
MHANKKRYGAMPTVAKPWLSIFVSSDDLEQKASDLEQIYN